MRLIPVLSLNALLHPGLAMAEPGLNGQSGLIAMPDARIEKDQVWRMGYSHADPYATFWTSVSALPWVEVSARLTRIMGVPGFPNSEYEKTYGDLKDKTFDAKLRLLDESRYGPALSVGFQDYLGTGLFRANYLVASKQFGNADVSLGVGSGRIDGPFAGIRYRPDWLENMAFVLEYDANNYAQDYGVEITGVDRRKKGLNAGIEYRHGPYAIQLASIRGEPGLNAYLEVPLSNKEFAPKILEPAPYMTIVSRPSAADWQRDASYRKRMLATLHAQDFKNVRLSLSHGVLEASLTNSRISRMSRAVGRAARILLLQGPVGLKEIKVTYTLPGSDLPLATYTFIDMNRLDRYFSGLISRRELAQYVSIHYASSNPVEESDWPTDDVDEPVKLGLDTGFDGDVVSMVREDTKESRWSLTPKYGFFFNHKSGPFRYDFFMRAGYNKHLADGLFLNAAADLSVLENVSEVDFSWPGKLPNVRTDLDDYSRGGDLKISRLLLNQFFQPAERFYARASAGIYETMYAGLGGQLLYMPSGGNWAADLSVDWVKKRDYEGGLGFLGYQTVTAIGALHYRLPYGLTVTGRVGRFLAQDNGVRLELKRRFTSGFEMGFWYTVTDKDDLNYNAPGTTEIYHDKGVFLNIPLNSLLPKDTRSVAEVVMSSWTVDSGQMVASPADLYAMLERPLLNDFHEADGLVELGDLNDDYHLPKLGDGASDWQKLGRFMRGSASGTGEFVSEGVVGKVALGLGLTALSASLDDTADEWAKDHGEHRLIKPFRAIGNALPFAAMASSGALWLLYDDERLNRTAWSSMQAGITSAVLGTALKYGIGRTRPNQEQGSDTFTPFSDGNLDSSFPSLHAAVAWAAVTPYAKEYGHDWLYGAALLTNFARVSGRDHWLSDTVGGALLGYALGNHFWQRNRSGGEGAQVMVTPNSVALSWTY